MPVFLETERLILRRFTKDDVDDPFELDNGPEVMRFLTDGKPTLRGEGRGSAAPPRRLRTLRGVRHLGGSRKACRGARGVVRDHAAV